MERGAILGSEGMVSSSKSDKAELEVAVFVGCVVGSGVSSGSEVLGYIPNKRTIADMGVPLLEAGMMGAAF